MNEIKTIKELAQLYKNGELKEADCDFVIFDKGRCELMTEKNYCFGLSQSEIAWQLLEEMGISVSDV